MQSSRTLRSKPGESFSYTQKIIHNQRAHRPSAKQKSEPLKITRKTQLQLPPICEEWGGNVVTAKLERKADDHDKQRISTGGGITCDAVWGWRRFKIEIERAYGEIEDCKISIKYGSQYRERLVNGQVPQVEGRKEIWRGLEARKSRVGRALTTNRAWTAVAAVFAAWGWRLDDHLLTNWNDPFMLE